MTQAPAPAESIALLIDADNAPANKIDFIMEELATLGAVNVRKAFGNWTKPELSRWQEVLADYAIQPVHNFDLVKGKNASDMALVIEAMDILSAKSVTLFCIVSSDCDFAPLALRLRAEGKRVIGFGAKQTPEPFVKSCNRFLFLDEDKHAQESREDKVTNARKLKGDTKLMNML
ncbi:MAG: NYN domain-containing protein, partial [Verrucomicrobiia bacterium]